MSDTQQSLIIKLLKKNKRRGVANYEFPMHRILRYSSRINELRHDGYNISCTREYLPNGRATNVFRYHLLDEDNF